MRLRQDCKRFLFHLISEREKVEQNEKTEELVPTERQEDTYEKTTNETETIYLVKN